MTSWKEGLPQMFSLYLWNVIRDRNGKIYGPKFYRDKFEYHKKWIESDPGRSNTRLRNLGTCCYCNTILTNENRTEEHIVGKRLDVVQFMMACCDICNSSKGKKDLIEWWCDFKGYDILKMKQDVLSIYVRGKYRLLKLDNNLEEQMPKIFMNVIEHLELPVYVK